MIALAAAMTPDGQIWTVPRPGRHDAALKRVHTESEFTAGEAKQGFVDNDGVFLTRTEAEPIARKAGQVGDIIGSVLTSEDLWNSWRCGYDVNERKVIDGCGAVYERPRHRRGRRFTRGKRISCARTTTCPECGKKDALNPRCS